MSQTKIGWEMFKFGIYIMFPIGVLALWGRSDIYDMFPTSQVIILLPCLYGVG